MSTAKHQLAMGGLYSALKQLADTLDRDASLLQAMMFVRAAMAGKDGLDPSVMESEMKTTPATITRTTQKLSAVGSDKKPGYNVATIDFNQNNRSRRVLALNSRGEKAVAEIGATLLKNFGARNS